MPGQTLGAESRALAGIVAGKLTAAVRIGERAFYDQTQMTRADACDHVAVTVGNMLWRDTGEGIAAVIGKRKPDRA